MNNYKTAEELAERLEKDKNVDSTRIVNDNVVTFTIEGRTTASGVDLPGFQGWFVDDIIVYRDSVDVCMVFVV